MSSARRRRSWPFLALVALVAVAVGGIVATSRPDSDGEQANSGVTDEPRVEHVHGLGINPANGHLIVATHYGSFRLPVGGGEPERIGTNYQDTMGFTVAGPDHFLGSGHPDVAGVRAGQPTRLGLIESTDAGVTWAVLSLGGEVDFHGLAFAHDTVYGWDAGTGRFMVSGDKRTWDTRSTVDLFGFAVDPANGDHIIGAAPSGLLESTDGGRTWSNADGPRLVTMGWDVENGLWGAEATGAVWQLRAHGWTQAGTLPGEPQAFLVTADTLYAAAHDAEASTGIYQSLDGGKTWRLRYRDPAR